MKQEIRKLLGSDALLIGEERTVKALRRGALAKVIIASNCRAEARARIERLAGGATVVVAAEDNDELAVLCKKPFRISVLGIKA